MRVTYSGRHDGGSIPFYTDLPNPKISEVATNNPERSLIKFVTMSREGKKFRWNPANFNKYTY